MSDTEIPMVPALWPFGHGVLALGHTVLPDASGMLVARALPDDLTGTPGDAPEDGVWEDASGAPQLMLHFRHADAVERLIGSLRKLAADLAVGAAA